VRDERVVVSAIRSAEDFDLTRAKDGVVFRVREGASVKLFPDVLVSVGARGQRDLARVALEAPRTVIIQRGEIYRQKLAEKAGKK
jgi:sRNA-binding carbon storage regulator CsrA